MARDGGLIDGDDFLSLFINQENFSNDRSFLHDDQRSGHSRTHESIRQSDDSISAPIKMLSAQTKRDEPAEQNSFPPATRIKHSGYDGYSESAIDQNNFNFIAKAESISNDTNTKDSTETDDTNGLNVVNLVTSGSKIVFLEELIGLDSNSTEPKHYVQNETTTNLFKNDEERPDEIKVISVRITSSQSQNADPIAYRSDTGSNEKENILISNVGKSDFSIEEVEPLTSESDKDSSKEESVHIESILDPPSAEEALEPIQTIIIHDHNYRKEGSARPRSVSYSSISQSVNQEIWKGNQKHGREHQLFNRTQHVSEPSAARLYSEPEQVYSEPAKIYSEASKVYGEPSKYYSEPAKVYSEPSKVYGEQEKIYSEPSKVYSEPARIYSEPSKVYSKPSKVYGEPSKVYGQPSKVYSLPAGTVYPTTSTTQAPSTQRPTKTSTTQPSQFKKVIFNLDKLPYDLLNAPAAEENKNYLFAPQLDNQRFHHFTRKSQEQQFETPLTQSHHENIGSELLVQSTVESTTPQHGSTPEQNYEIDEAVSVMTNGQQHGVQPPTNSPSNAATDPDPKVGFVVEGRNFRKYRVEEKTPDGFIVGEYGVVSNNDGSLRGVRYTADSNISPNLIYEALMKFLSL